MLFLIVNARSHHTSHTFHYLFTSCQQQQSHFHSSDCSSFCLLQHSYSQLSLWYGQSSTAHSRKQYLIDLHRHLYICLIGAIEPHRKSPSACSKFHANNDKDCVCERIWQLNEDSAQYLKEDQWSHKSKCTHVSPAHAADLVLLLSVSCRLVYE
jgi:hypothetical protein